MTERGGVPLQRLDPDTLKPFAMAAKNTRSWRPSPFGAVRPTTNWWSAASTDGTAWKIRAVSGVCGFRCKCVGEVGRATPHRPVARRKVDIVNALELGNLGEHGMTGLDQFQHLRARN